MSLSKFIPMYDAMHVDEKLLTMHKDVKHLYMALDEHPFPRTTQNKNHPERSYFSQQ